MARSPTPRLPRLEAYRNKRDMTRLTRIFDREPYSQDIEDKFAKMRLTPSPSPSPSASHGIPLLVYTQVKRAVDIMKRHNGQNEAKYLHDLERAEYGILVATDFYRPYLPLGWRYDRESASSLIAGYEKIYQTKDGLQFIARVASVG